MDAPILHGREIGLSFFNIHEPDIQLVDCSLGELADDFALAANFQLTRYPLPLQRDERGGSGSGVQHHFGIHIQKEAFIEFRKLFYQGKLHELKRLYTAKFILFSAKDESFSKKTSFAPV